MLIVGGGIVGLATAFRLSQRLPGAEITVVEKESSVGRHQTGHNSGVLHSGLYYKPGSLKARLAVRGIRQMVEFCREHSIPHEICGKLVVAADEAELPRLRDLHVRGLANGLEGLRMLGPQEMREIEPHAGGVAALRVPQEGIVDYQRVCEALVKCIHGRVVTDAKVRSLRQTGSGWSAETEAGHFEAKFLINCAGLHCDRVSELAGLRREVRIVPFRGEYYKIKPDRQSLVRHLIYPVPDPKFPFLGVHFTRLIHGGVEAGPNAVLAGAAKVTARRISIPRGLFDAVSYSGLWQLFGAVTHAMCWEEVERSFSKRLFCRIAAAPGPGDPRIDGSQIPGDVGVRAQAITPQGELVQDFHFVDQANAVHVLNAPSPGATASLAIGEEIVARLGVG